MLDPLQKLMFVFTVLKQTNKKNPLSLDDALHFDAQNEYLDVECLGPY